MQNADRVQICYSELTHSFSKPKSFIHWICSVLSFYAVSAFQNCLLWCAETKRAFKRVFRKIEIIHVWHIVSSVAQKQNSVDFSNSSCKLAMLSKVYYQKTRIASPQVIWIFKIRASSVP